MITSAAYLISHAYQLLLYAIVLTSPDYLLVALLLPMHSRLVTLLTNLVALLLFHVHY